MEEVKEEPIQVAEEEVKKDVVTDEQREYERKFKEKTGMSVEEYVVENLKKKFKTQISTVIEYALTHGKSVDDMINEIKEKKSPFSRSTRDFLMEINPDLITGWIDEFKK